MQISIHPCQKGDILPLIAQKNAQNLRPHLIAHTHHGQGLPSWPVGTDLFHTEQVQAEQFQPKNALFKVVGRILQPLNPHARHLPLLMALQPLQAQTVTVSMKKHGYSLAWVTLSDKGFAGLRIDESGPCIEKILSDELSLCHIQGFILPDDALSLRTLILELSLGQGYDIICTTGGTGLTQRDVTPEAIMPLLDKRLHGFEQAMLMASLQITPNAMLSRAVVGSINTCFGSTLCINLPGSVKAVQENLAAILPALPHALSKLHNDTSDCAQA